MEIEPAPALLVVCLCAGWCNVCTDYRSQFEQVQKRLQPDHPQARFLWLDVEDEADLLDPLDVENFPTLLIAAGDSPRFFGPLTPKAHTLERLLCSILSDPTGLALADLQVQAAVVRIRAGKPVGRQPDG